MPRDNSSSSKPQKRKTAQSRPREGSSAAAQGTSGPSAMKQNRPQDMPLPPLPQPSSSTSLDFPSLNDSGDISIDASLAQFANLSPMAPSQMSSAYSDNIPLPSGDGFYRSPVIARPGQDLPSYALPLQASPPIPQGMLNQQQNSENPANWEFARQNSSGGTSQGQSLGNNGSSSINSMLIDPTTQPSSATFNKQNPQQQQQQQSQQAFHRTHSQSVSQSHAQPPITHSSSNQQQTSTFAGGPFPSALSASANHNQPTQQGSQSNAQQSRPEMQTQSHNKSESRQQIQQLQASTSASSHFGAGPPAANKTSLSSTSSSHPLYGSSHTTAAGLNQSGSMPSGISPGGDSHSSYDSMNRPKRKHGATDDNRIADPDALVAASLRNPVDALNLLVLAADTREGKPEGGGKKGADTTQDSHEGDGQGFTDASKGALALRGKASPSPTPFTLSDFALVKRGIINSMELIYFVNLFFREPESFPRGSAFGLNAYLC